nr:hypothetical protein [Tanacetum cinerariifolium]
KEAAEKPKPAENVKELVEKPKESAEKAHEVPKNVKPKPAAVKTKEATEKPKPAKNVKEVAEKPKEPVEKAQEAPQYVKPKSTGVKTKKAAEKPMPAENVKELAEKPKEPAGDDYQVVPAATVMKAEDREEFKVETFTRWIEGNIDWVGEGYVKPVKTVNTPYMCRRIDVITRYKRIEFVLGNSLFAMEGDKYETVFQSLGGYRELSSVPVNMETLAPTLCIDANVIDCWVALLNFEELALGYPTPTIMLHQFNAVSNKMFDFAFTFETKYTEQARVSMIVDAIKNRNNRDPPKQVKETDAANVVVGVNEVVDQVKEKRRRKK